MEQRNWTPKASSDRRLVTKSDCCVHGQCPAKVQNFDDCLLSFELLNLVQPNSVIIHKKIGLQSSRSRAQGGLMTTASFLYFLSCKQMCWRSKSQQVKVIATVQFQWWSGWCNLNLLQPNLVQWGIVMKQSVIQKDRFTVFKVTATVRVLIVKLGLFLHLLNCFHTFATKLFYGKS